MKRLVFLLVLCLLLTGCAGSSAPAPTAAPAVTAAPTSTDAPAGSTADVPFSTADRDGNPWTDASLKDYSLVMLNFWEPWCGPCVGEMPELQKLYEAYADRGFLLLGVYSTEGMEADVDAVLKSAGITYPILRYCDAFDAFQSGYVPTTVFLDGDGRVLTVNGKTSVAGAKSYEAWAAMVESLL